MKLSPSGSVIWAISGIVILGGALRFCCLPYKGLFFWDEGMHMQEAQCLCSIAAGLKEHVGACALVRKVEEKLTGRDLSHVEEGLNSIGESLKGRYPETAKPTHIALIAASMALFGDHDYCGNVMSALLGTLTIVVVYFLGKRLGGTVVGLVSAFLLAVSPLHIIYSRETLAESDSIFFFYCAFLLWLRSKDVAASKAGCLFLAGICAGLSLTCNDRWIIIPPIFLFLEIAAKGLSAKNAVRGIFANYGLWIVGFCVPLVAWEAIYYLLKNSLSLIPMDYFDQLQARTVFHARFSLGYEGAWAVLMTIARFEGRATALLLACGVVTLCARRRREDAYLLIILFFTFALYAFRPHHFLRIISLAIPCFYLIAASVLCRAGQVLMKRRPGASAMLNGAVAVFVFLVVAPDLSRDVRIVHWRSRYEEAMEYLRSKTPSCHYSTNKELSGYYMGNASVERPPRKMDMQDETPSAPKISYLIAEKQRYFQTTFGPSESEWVDEVEKKCRPVFEVREDFDGLFFEHFAFEHSIDYAATGDFLKRLRVPEAATLRIYKLDGCPKGGGESGGGR